MEKALSPLIWLMTPVKNIDLCYVNGDDKKVFLKNINFNSNEAIYLKGQFGDFMEYLSYFYAAKTQGKLRAQEIIGSYMEFQNCCSDRK